MSFLEEIFSIELGIVELDAPSPDAPWLQAYKAGLTSMKKMNHKQAISSFSVALRSMPRTNDATTQCVKLNRAVSYIELSCSYRRRSAAESEWSALLDIDPVSLLELADKDLSSLPVAGSSDLLNIKVFLTKGKTFALLEKFAEAREAFLSALALDPDEDTSKKGLASVTKILASSTAKRQKVSSAGGGGEMSSPDLATAQQVSILSDLECLICLKLLYQPVTTPCGHTFCRACFSRAIDHSQNRCPACRTLLHCDRRLPVTILLQNILQKNFSLEYEERRKEEEGALDTGEGADGSVTLPLFVMSSFLPGETMGLNIFEPRYRLMVRRAMEGNRMIGMAQSTRAGGLDPVLCEGEIIDCASQPDGRYALEIKGRRRMRLEPSSLSEVDGYRIARCSPFHDNEAQDVAAMEAKAVDLIAAVDLILNAINTTGLAQRIRPLLEQLGPRPAIDGNLAGGNKARKIEELTFWVASLLASFSSILDRQGSKHLLLQITNTLERLNLLLSIIPSGESFVGAGSGRCSIQ